MKVKISVLGSGSSGNCIYIKDGKTAILIDAGMSGKEIERRLKACGGYLDDISAILLTHEHIDHIHGAGILSRRCDIPLYANNLTWQAACDKLGKIKKKNRQVFSGDFMVGDLGMEPVSISHDASDPVGYIVNVANKKIAIATDMGYMSEEIKQKLYGFDFLIIEANHDYEMLTNGSYPAYLKKRILGKKGHLSNDDTAAILPELINGHQPCILLAHLSKDNNRPELAYITIKNNLQDNGLHIDRDLNLNFTYREKPTEVYKI